MAKSVKAYIVDNTEGENPIGIASSGTYVDEDERIRQIRRSEGFHYKGFPDQRTADLVLEHVLRPPFEEGPVAFVDGSWTKKHPDFVGGGVVFYESVSADQLMGKDRSRDPQLTQEASLSFAGEEFQEEHQVLGECTAAMRAIKMATDLGLDRLLIVFDYFGVMSVPEYMVTAKSPAQKRYFDFVNRFDRGINRIGGLSDGDCTGDAKLDLRFLHVHSHPGSTEKPFDEMTFLEYGNYRADELAMDARDFAIEYSEGA